MVCVTQSMISASTCVFPSHKFHKTLQTVKPNGTLFRIRTSSNSEVECNDEECAPDKEVGKVSMEWLAGEKTKVSGTFPPKKKGWTGYVEKDTAGQTNIYSVEPAVYVAESAISSGTQGTSSEGAENTAAIAAGLGLIFIAAASAILLQVSKNSPPAQNTEYSGPSLSYYINEFKQPEIVAEIVDASIAIPPESSPSVPLESSAPESPGVQVESNNQEETPPQM
ncbi:Maintenance of psii under high light [Thalictrum thalictroides]|uniref:Maintenance of psii under high light n=1 Tax=Thalictrum thalictroides TaxID=46969 RepID=A0A7J6VC77_THATH|nr:Maintenance of psii under high light [Thalictrum thalictroides]